MLSVTDHIKEGISSHVFECFNIIIEDIVVAKKYKREYCFARYFFNELQWISLFTHPTIITYKGYSKQDECNILFMERCDHDFFDEVQIKETLAIEEVRSRFKIIFDGIALIHSKDVVHRDIELENISIMKNCDLKLLDFESCCSLHSNTFNHLETLFYLSLEAKLPENDLKKCDV
jgi:serine/threonine protein kinase